MGLAGQTSWYTIEWVFSIIYSSISKVSIAKVSARFALKLGVAIEGVFLD